MLKRLFLLTLLLIVSLTMLFNCERDKDDITGIIETKETGNTLDYFVYTAALNLHKDSANPVFVLGDSTLFYDISDEIDYIKEHFPDLQNSTIQDYLAKNQNKIELMDIPDLEVTCYLIDEENANQWKELHPNAYALIHFSQVGFNILRDQGLVYFTDFSAPLSAAGQLIMLKKDSSGWKIAKSLMLWIA